MNTKDLKASKKLLKKYRNGDSIPRKEIAEALGCHEQTIYNHFKNSGFKKCPFAGNRLTNYPYKYLNNLIKQLEREKKLSGNKKLKPVKKNPTKRELKANGAGGRLTVEDLAKATSMKAANIRVRFKEFCNSYADNIDSLCITYRKKHYYVVGFLDYLKAYPKPNPNYKVDKKVENNKNISDSIAKKVIKEPLVSKTPRRKQLLTLQTLAKRLGWEEDSSPKIVKLFDEWVIQRKVNRSEMLKVKNGVLMYSHLLLEYIQDVNKPFKEQTPIKEYYSRYSTVPTSQTYQEGIIELLDRTNWTYFGGFRTDFGLNTKNCHRIMTIYAVQIIRLNKDDVIYYVIEKNPRDEGFHVHFLAKTENTKKGLEKLLLKRFNYFKNEENLDMKIEVEIREFDKDQKMGCFNYITKSLKTGNRTRRPAKNNLENWDILDHNYEGLQWHLEQMALYKTMYEGVSNWYENSDSKESDDSQSENDENITYYYDALDGQIDNYDTLDGQNDNYDDSEI